MSGCENTHETLALCEHNIPMKLGCSMCMRSGYLGKQETQCICLCHTRGFKTILTCNPPKPCCRCESFPSLPIEPLGLSPYKPKIDIEILLERIEKLEEEKKDLVDWLNGTITCLEKRIEKLEAQKIYRAEMRGVNMRLNRLENKGREDEAAGIIA